MKKNNIVRKIMIALTICSFIAIVGYYIYKHFLSGSKSCCDKDGNKCCCKKKEKKKYSVVSNIDPLTGIRNMDSYLDECRKLDIELKEGGELGIATVDLNYLGKTNDRYGFEKGNEAIKELCYIVCHVFDHSPVFRIGGDSFAIILKNDDLRDYDILLDEFELQIGELSMNVSLKPWEKITAAIGAAFYDSETDKSINDVFLRAKENMLKNKKEMEAVSENEQG